MGLGCFHLKSLEQVVSQIPGILYHTTMKPIVDKNNIGAPKMRNNYWFTIKLINFPILRRQYWTFMYCSHKVNVLPTLRQHKLLLQISLLFLYWFCTLVHVLFFYIALSLAIAHPYLAIVLSCLMSNNFTVSSREKSNINNSNAL